MSVGALDLADAARAVQAIQSSCFTLDQRTAITLAIDAVVSNSASTASSSVATCRSGLKPQTHEFFHNYLTANDWTLLRCPSTTMPAKIEAAVCRCELIGLLSMTERTAVHVTSTIVAANGQPCATDTCFGHLTTLKEYMKKMRARRQPTTLPTCQVFPERVSEFVAVHSTAYFPQDPPMACPIDVKTIGTLTSSLPCRKTHISMRGSAFDLQGLASGSHCRGHRGSPSFSMQDMVGIAHAVVAMQGREAKQLGMPSLPQTPQMDRCQLALQDITPEHGAVAAGAGTPGTTLAVPPLPAVAPQPTPDMLTSGIASVSSAVKAALEAKANAAETAKGKAKAKGKATAKGKAAVGAMKRPAAAPPAEEAPAKKPLAGCTKPLYSIERSRDQICCRTGMKGPGQNVIMKFANYGGEVAAVKHAKAWVTATCLELGCEPPAY